MAKIQRKVSRADWGKLSPDRQDLYVERNGEYVLDSDDAEQLHNALTSTKDELAKAKARLASMEDVDPDEYQRLKTAADDAARAKEVEKGNFEKLLAQDREVHAKALKDKDDHALKMRGQIEELIVDGELTRAINAKYPGAKVTPILLGAKQSVRPMEIDGKIRAVVLDEKGEPRLRAGAKTTDDFMGPADRIDEMRNDKEWAGNFPASSVANPSTQRTIRASPQDRSMMSVADSLAQQVRDGNTKVS